MQAEIGRRISNPVIPNSLEELLNIGTQADSAFVKVTPGLAKEVIEKANTNNRPVSKLNVSRLAEQMSAGSWTQGLTKLIFSSAGRFLDGQHRLTAIIQSGQPCVFDCTFNMSEDAFGCLDTNKKRNASDTLSVYGYKNLSTLSSMIRKTNHYYKNKGNMWNINTPCSNSLVIELASQNQKFQEIASLLDNKKDFSIYGNKSDMGSCYAIFDKIDPVLAEDFMNLIISNSTEYKGIRFDNLFSTLRKELTKNRNSAHKIHAGKKTDPHESESRTFWYMFDAFNIFRTGVDAEISNKVSRKSFPRLETFQK